MKYYAAFHITLLLISSIHGHSQQNVLSGTITTVEGPAKGITVYTSFATSTTDNLGRYNLSLDGCASCRVGDRINIYTYSVYGSSVNFCTIPRDYRYDFSISENSPSVFAIGMVQNSATGDGLPGIAVRVLLDEIDIEPVYTNQFGEFRITIPKSQVEGVNAIRLQAYDSSRTYRPLRSEPELYSFNSFIVIRMGNRNSVFKTVDSFTYTGVCVRAGDLVTLEASGQILVGGFIGTSDPDGRTSALTAVILEPYCIEPSINHAALMYRVSGERKWKLAGKKKRFIANRDGCIELRINDSKPSDNDGYYEVEISVEKN